MQTSCGLRALLELGEGGGVAVFTAHTVIAVIDGEGVVENIAAVLLTAAVCQEPSDAPSRLASQGNDGSP